MEQGCKNRERESFVSRSSKKVVKKREKERGNCFWIEQGYEKNRERENCF